MNTRKRDHDVWTLLDGRPELIEEVGSAQPHLRTYIQKELSELRADPYFSYSLEGAVATYGHLSAERARIAQTRIDDLLA